MVYPGARLAGIIMAVSMAVVADTGLAYAETPSDCGAQAYAYAACGPSLQMAQTYAAVIVAGVVALAVGCGVAGARYHTVP
ncbi:MAG: hypothetical protein KGI33_04880 [Thaumarchaeota archaeon]|nr:hypothetical protein [Nitrososphaerota archaeon]